MNNNNNKVCLDMSDLGVVIKKTQNGFLVEYIQESLNDSYESSVERVVFEEPNIKFNKNSDYDDIDYEEIKECIAFKSLIIYLIEHFTISSKYIDINLNFEEEEKGEYN